MRSKARISHMKHHCERPHPGRIESLRAGEHPQPIAGDPVALKRDMSREQQAALQKPGQRDPRVAESEADQGRTS